MPQYEINLSGCDDETIFTVDITDKEAEFLQRIAEKSKETSHYGCMPIMFVTPMDKGEENGS